MKNKSLFRLQLSHTLALQTWLQTVTAVMRRIAAPVMVFLALASGGVTAASEKHVASEFLEEDVQDTVTSAGIIAVLDQTVGTGAASGVNPAIAHPLRRGLYVTAIPRRSNIVLRFEVDRSDTNQRYTVAEVAISADLGSKFFEFAKAALGSAESVFSSNQFAQAWELGLNAQSDSGGQVTVKVQGDGSAHFTLAWEIASPKRPIDSFVVPVAFGSKKDGTEHISVTVHFPTSLEEFAFLSAIYVGGVEERFQDLPLYPHTWLHLTVTNGSTNRFVLVHFDAITTDRQRTFVAEAPASTDVGGRFLNQTLMRMQEMLDQESGKPGSSGKWTTEFYYDTADKGVVVVAVAGQQGRFDVSYQLQTSTQNVKRRGESSDEDR
jgi:hypothetical protein